METVHLEPAQVPHNLRGGYTGKKFRAQVAETFSIPADSGLWSGGSRETFELVNLATGESVRDPVTQTAPWNAARTVDRTFPIPQGVCIRKHSMFCGKDMGLTFVLNPADVAKLLPAGETVELTFAEKVVLCAVVGLKSSYRQETYNRAKLTSEQVSEAKSKLMERGFLNNAGAATVKGKNARTDQLAREVRKEVEGY